MVKEVESQEGEYVQYFAGGGGGQIEYLLLTIDD